VVEELVEGGFHGAAGVEHVVHEDHGRAVDVVRDDGRRKFLRDRVAADVVAVERDVDRAGAGPEAGLFKAGGETGGEDDAAVGDAEEQEAIGRGVPGGNGGSNARDGLVDRLGVVLQRCGHEPKVLRGGTGAVERKG
jgi:hypothetical protein